MKEEVNNRGRIIGGVDLGTGEVGRKGGVVRKKTRPDGRTVFCNAYVEDPTRLILVVYNPVQKHWTLPGGVVHEHENPQEACVRALLSECGVGTKQLLPLYEDDAGRDGYVIAYHAVIDGMPRVTHEGAEVSAMTPETFLTMTPFPKFYSRLFAVATTHKLYCVVVERCTDGVWDLEKHHLHSFSREAAQRDFMLGEVEAVQAGMLRFVECAEAIGYKVEDSKGEKLSA
jgi:ADP-ribose pyrophosphatase YjhB (NUDIX family)